MASLLLVWMIVYAFSRVTGYLRRYDATLEQWLGYETWPIIGITRLWLADVNISWDMSHWQCILGSGDRWESPSFTMMASSNGNIFCVTGHLCGNSPVSGEFPAQRPVTRSFDVFFDLRPNKRLSKQWWGWWFETLSCPLWRHCNAKGQWEFPSTAITADK